MVYVKRKDNETTGAMVRRFTRRVQLSGVLLNSRKRRRFIAKPSKRAVRESALRRSVARKERAWLDKLGKLKDER
jgi:ribosomal protein S21